jgi:hypothetical protein
MKLVKDKLDSYVKKEIFSWNDIPGNLDESNKLKHFLKENYNTDWVGSVTQSFKLILYIQK